MKRVINITTIYGSNVTKKEEDYVKNYQKLGIVW